MMSDESDGDASPGAKRALRREIADRVARIPAFARAVRADRLAATVLRAPALAGARTVLCYRAMPDEIDLDPLVRLLAARGGRIAFPAVADGGAMLLLAIDAADPLDPRHWARDRFGIAAPKRDAPGVARIHAREIDAAVVPGRAFDRTGARLGRGKGYYDALLPRLRPDARRATIGACFREQLVDCVPIGPRDRRVASVAAEGRLLVARPAQGA